MTGKSCRADFFLVKFNLTVDLYTMFLENAEVDGLFFVEMSY